MMDVYIHNTKIVNFYAIIMILLLSSCGPAWHLKRRDYHERQAIAKGAIVTPDTIWASTVVEIPGVSTDTVFQLSTDTLTLEKEHVRTKVVVSVREKKVYVSSECEPRTIIQKVPVTITKTIQAKSLMDTWNWIILLIVLCLVSYFVGRFTKRRYM